MKTTYKDGFITFETNHFSQYIVTYELTAATIAGTVVACVVFAAGIAVLVVLLLKKKKGGKGNAPKAEEPVEEVVVDEQPVAEAANE